MTKEQEKFWNLLKYDYPTKKWCRNCKWCWPPDSVCEKPVVGSNRCQVDTYAGWEWEHD